MTINIAAALLPQLLPPEATQEGRWRLLQEWIRDNPIVAECIDNWLDMTPDAIFPELREVVACLVEDEYGALGGAIARAAEATPDTLTWIENLQSLYKERKALEGGQKKKSKGARDVRRKNTL
jgi:hypothetical protein